MNFADLFEQNILVKTRVTKSHFSIKNQKDLFFNTLMCVNISINKKIFYAFKIFACFTSTKQYLLCVEMFFQCVS